MKRSGVWHCLEQLAREHNPRLVAILEAKDARHLLAIRATLMMLATTAATKRQITKARRLLAHR